MKILLYMMFDEIKSELSKYNRDSILLQCCEILNNYKGDKVPIWNIFCLMKWSYLFSSVENNTENVTDRTFLNLLKYVSDIQDRSLKRLLEAGKEDQFFYTLSAQQFYLQKSTNGAVFARQMILCDFVKNKYSANESFSKRTNLTIKDFLILAYCTWIVIHSDLVANEIDPNNFINKNIKMLLYSAFEKSKVDYFINLLSLEDYNASQNILKYKNLSKIDELQPLESTFYTLYPFQYFQSKLKLIHPKVFDYAANYFIYDYLKSNDIKFTETFGASFEKYIELGIKETALAYITENQLKKILGRNHKVVDFMIDGVVLIECKAIELQSNTSINPTDDLLFSSLEDSIIKAYTKQMLSIAKSCNTGTEMWGIIVTYKEFFWCSLQDIWRIIENKTDEFCLNNNFDINILPPENVFIIDIDTWDTLVQIIKNGKVEMIDLLRQIKYLHRDDNTKKLLFNMYLEKFKSTDFFFNLNYLKPSFEIMSKILDIRE